MWLHPLSRLDRAKLPTIIVRFCLVSKPARRLAMWQLHTYCSLEDDVFYLISLRDTCVSGQHLQTWLIPGARKPWPLVRSSCIPIGCSGVVNLSSWRPTNLPKWALQIRFLCVQATRGCSWHTHSLSHSGAAAGNKQKNEYRCMFRRCFSLDRWYWFAIPSVLHDMPLPPTPQRRVYR